MPTDGWPLKRPLIQSFVVSSEVVEKKNVEKIRPSRRLLCHYSWKNNFSGVDTLKIRPSVWLIESKKCIYYKLGRHLIRDFGRQLEKGKNDIFNTFTTQEWEAK